MIRGRLLTAFAVAAGAAAVAAGSATALLQARTLRSAWPPESDLYFLPGSNLIRVLSLGHAEAAADLIAARANVYFGTQLAQNTDPDQDRRMERFLNTVADLDPKFQRIYQQGAAMLVYGGSKITVDKIDAAVRFLERGLHEFPGSSQIAFNLGFNYYWELPSAAGPDDPRVPRWRQKGLDALRQAALLDGAPPWLPSLVARILTKQGQDELAIKHLEEAYMATSNEKTREQIRDKLIYLRQATAAAALARDERELADELAKRYTFAPESFSLVAGPRRTAKPLAALMRGEDTP